MAEEKEKKREATPTTNKESQKVYATNEWDKINKEYAQKQQTLAKNIENKEKEYNDASAKEAKKYRNRQIINAISDGISALSNLYFTSKGAPNVPMGETLTGREKARYDKARSNAEARKSAYLKAMREEGAKEIGNWYTMKKDELKTKQEEAKLKLAEDKENRLKLESDAKLILHEHKANEAQAKALIAAAQAGNAEEYQRLKKELIESQIKKNEKYQPGGSGSKNYTKKKTIMIPIRNGLGEITGYEEREVVETKEYGIPSNNSKQTTTGNNKEQVTLRDW